MGANEDLTKLLDEFHYHEALDRVHIIMEMLDTHVHQHPVCKINKEISKLVEDAQISLYQAYQLIGEKSLK